LNFAISLTLGHSTLSLDRRTNRTESLKFMCSLENGMFIELIRNEQDKRIVMAYFKRRIDSLIFANEEF